MKVEVVQFRGRIDAEPGVGRVGGDMSAATAVCVNSSRSKPYMSACLNAVFHTEIVKQDARPGAPLPVNVTEHRVWRGRQFLLCSWDCPWLTISPWERRTHSTRRTPPFGKYLRIKEELYRPVFSSSRCVPATCASPRRTDMMPPMLPTWAELIDVSHQKMRMRSEISSISGSWLPMATRLLFSSSGRAQQPDGDGRAALDSPPVPAVC